MRRRDPLLGAKLMVRSLNNLHTRFREQMPAASEQEVEDAMYGYLHRCERARNALGKDWMQWFPTGSMSRSSQK